jgi:hypothetical protein
MSVSQCVVALVMELWTIYSLDVKSGTRRALLSGGHCESTAMDGVPEEHQKSKAKGKAKAL